MESYSARESCPDSSASTRDQTDPRYECAFRDAGEAMLLVDRNILDCNNAALELFRTEPHRLIGFPLSNLLAAGDSLDISETHPRRFRSRFIRSDRTHFDVDVTLSPAGNSGSYLLILRPSSDAAPVSATDLSSRFDSLNRELDSLYYSISHDLRAAIHGIAACSQIVLEDYAPHLDDEGKRWLNHIHDDAQRLDHFTGALLDLSRVSHAVLNIAEIDLSSLAAGIGSQLAAGSPSRKVDFEVQPGLTAAGDPDLIRRIVYNLLDNAWKFTAKQKDARIEFGGFQSESGEETWFVGDNGVGFDMAQSDRLFVAFQRLHGDPAIPGVGVGLAAVRRIVNLHGGAAWAEGEPNVGATFFFTLHTRLP